MPESAILLPVSLVGLLFNLAEVRLLTVLMDLPGEIGFAISYQAISNSSLFTMLLAISLFTIVITLLARYAYRSNRQRIIAESKILDLERSITDLKHTRNSLEKEIARLEREHSNSEMLYGMMLSSAEDGIAFYNTDSGLSNVMQGILFFRRNRSRYEATMRRYWGTS